MPDSAETMKAMNFEWFSTGIDAIVGAIVGWLIGSFLKASKSDLRTLAESVSERFERFDEHARSYVTKAELREAIIDLKTESRAQFESIRSDLARIQAALLNDRNR